MKKGLAVFLAVILSASCLTALAANGDEYEILLDFSDGQYSSNLIELFRSVSSGNQALPIHNEEEKYDLVNEKN